MTIQLAVRLPDDLVKGIDGLVARTHGSRSEIIRCALEAYIYRQACEDDAEKYAQVPLTDSELALADDPSGWGSTPSW